MEDIRLNTPMKIEEFSLTDLILDIRKLELPILLLIKFILHHYYVHEVFFVFKTFIGCIHF